MDEIWEGVVLGGWVVLGALNRHCIGAFRGFMGLSLGKGEGGGKRNRCCMLTDTLFTGSSPSTVYRLSLFCASFSALLYFLE